MGLNIELISHERNEIINPSSEGQSYRVIFTIEARNMHLICLIFTNSGLNRTNTRTIHLKFNILSETLYLL